MPDSSIPALTFSLPVEYRDLSIVPRWGIARRVKEQSVAEHSYYVALYSDRICRHLRMDEVETLQVVRYAMVHDLAEIATGDIPGPAKRASSGQWGLLEGEYIRSRFPDAAQDHSEGTQQNWIHDIVKAADMLDACLYLLGEVRLGNTNLGSYFDPPERSCFGMNVFRLQAAWDRVFKERSFPVTLMLADADRLPNILIG